jgi:iron(III) transport system permease protein
MASGRGAAFAGATLILIACCVAPLGVLLLAPSLTGRWDAYASAWLDVRQLQLLVNSVRIAAGVMMLATAIGSPLGFLLARVPIPARHAVRLALALPVVLPTYALALSWVYLTGSAGLAARLFASDALAQLTYSRLGVLIVLGLALYPIPMLATEAAARRIESRLEEAALVVASPMRAFARVTFPLLWPSIASSALLTFVLALSDYSVPNLLQQRVYTTEVFTAFAAFYDVSRATALALPLIGVAFLVGYVMTRSGTRVLDTSRTSSRIGVALPRLRGVTAMAMAAVFSVSVVLPFSVLAAEAGSLAAIGQGLARSGAAVAESLLLASVAATMICGVSLVLGYHRARSHLPRVRWVDAALIALFGVPGTIVGVALIYLWNRPGPMGLVYGTSAMIVLAYMARFIPVATLILGAGVRRVSRSSEDAAVMSGAGWARMMRHIVVPQLATSLLVAWVLVFVLAFGEVGASVLVAPPGHAPYPVHVFTLIANAPTEHVAALALLQAAVIACPFAIAAAFTPQSRPRHE